MPDDSPGLPARSYSIDLADDIPMTGTPGPLFGAVDEAMRQFVKWRCVGGATLAISYRGRRVYKRGFGRMRGRASAGLYDGCGDDASNPFDPDSPLVQPDTPLTLASLTKPVTAAVARWLVEERMAARPEVVIAPCTGPGCDCEEAPCPVTAADVPLLMPEMELLPPPLASALRGETPLPSAAFPDDEPCVDGHDTTRADPRWRDVTIGNLISHQAGLPRHAPTFASKSGAIHNLIALRGYSDTETEWMAEDANVRARHPAWSAEIDAATTWLSERHGGAPIYFIDLYNDLADARPFDERLLLGAGACLRFNPGQSGMFDFDRGIYSAIGQSGSYSNFGADVVGRVIDHLQRARASGVYTADDGLPSTHQLSAIQEFFAAEVGLVEGVETPEGITTWHMAYDPARPLSQPYPRHWKNGTYEPVALDPRRPYCVWTSGGCDLEPWLDGAGDDDATLRPDWTFRLNAEDPSRGFETVPIWASQMWQSSAAGGLVAEAPVYLRFMNYYTLSQRTGYLDNHNGDRREPGWEFGEHGGNITGGTASAIQLAGGPLFASFLPIVDGHIVDAFDERERVVLELPAGVDFVVGVNQWGDSRCEDELFEYATPCLFEYNLLKYFVLYGIAQVDWDAVAAAVDGQRERPVGMAIDDAGAASLWFADDHALTLAGSPDTFAGRDAHGEASMYRLPSTRIGPDVVGVAIAPDQSDHVVAWFDDGRVSEGTRDDLSALASPEPFTLPAGLSPGNIVGVGINSDGDVHAWYDDGTRSAGTITDLTATLTDTRYSTDASHRPGDIAAIAIDPSDGDRVWTLYADGAVSSGVVGDLGAG